jgi:hypothetical protein
MNCQQQGKPNVLTGSQAENKIKQGIEQAGQTVKQRLESS